MMTFSASMGLLLSQNRYRPFLSHPSMSSFLNTSHTRTMAMNRHSTVTGSSLPANSAKVMCDWVAMNAFCGFPTGVATLPMLADIASATRKGIGLALIKRQALITMGVNRSTTVSFSISAESRAVTNITSIRNWNWFLEAWIIFTETQVKKPQSSSETTMIIMPSRRPRMSSWIAANAWSAATTPKTTINAAPKRATAGLSRFSLPKRLTEIRR